MTNKRKALKQEELPQSVQNAEVSTTNIVKQTYDKNTHRVDLAQHVKESMIEFMYGICVDQAIPSALDGLKPVHRRILATAHQANLYYNKPYKKSVHVVGSCLSLYHPKGL